MSEFIQFLSNPNSCDKNYLIQLYDNAFKKAQNDANEKLKLKPDANEVLFGAEEISKYIIPELDKTSVSVFSLSELLQMYETIEQWFPEDPINGYKFAAIQQAVMNQILLNMEVKLLKSDSFDSEDESQDSDEDTETLSNSEGNTPLPVIERVRLVIQEQNLQAKKPKTNFIMRFIGQTIFNKSPNSQIDSETQGKAKTQNKKL